ncbi:MAG: hypothetical protein ACREVB_18625, partial [Burkholderiales bacterium]
MKSHAHRPIPLALTALIAFFSALVALGVSNGHSAHAHSEPHSAVAHAVHPRSSATVTRKELVFRGEMRRLWEDHITWTRLAVISLISGSPDTNATVARLLRNQADLGNAVKPFYGDAAGAQLTTLLRERIVIAGTLLTTAKSGDADTFAAAKTEWYRNGDDIARFLAIANPHWPLAEMQAAMTAHLDTTLA